mgnify:CR=1 FL=1
MHRCLTRPLRWTGGGHITDPLLRWDLPARLCYYLLHRLGFRLSRPSIGILEPTTLPTGGLPTKLRPDSMPGRTPGDVHHLERLRLPNPLLGRHLPTQRWADRLLDCSSGPLCGPDCIRRPDPVPCRDLQLIRRLHIGICLHFSGPWIPLTYLRLIRSSPLQPWDLAE